MYVYIYICIYIYVYIYVYMYIYMYIYILYELYLDPEISLNMGEKTQKSFLTLHISIACEK